MTSYLWWLSVCARMTSRELSCVFQTLMDRRIRPWVNKKIVEYIGDEEPTLSNFICEKVMAHSTPSAILSDIAMVSTCQ